MAVRPVLRSPRTAPPSFSAKLALAETLHPTVKRYEGDAAAVRDALDRLPAILRAQGLTFHDTFTQHSRPHDPVVREDVRQFWHQDGEHLHVYANIYPNNEQLSGVAIVAPEKYHGAIQEWLYA